MRDFNSDRRGRRTVLIPVTRIFHRNLNVLHFVIYQIKFEIHSTTVRGQGSHFSVSSVDIVQGACSDCK